MQGLSSLQLPRPMTHDLSLRLLEPLGATVQQVVISRITNDTFFADITVQAGAQTFTIDARPSDALALAVRAGAPVLVAPVVLEQAATNEEPANLELLGLDTPPTPQTTGLLIGMLEAEQQAIVGAVLGAALGMTALHLEPIIISEVLAAVQDSGASGPAIAVVDLAVWRSAAAPRGAAVGDGINPLRQRPNAASSGAAQPAG